MGFSFDYLAGPDMGLVAGFLVFLVVVYLLLLALSVVMYILQSLGSYTIAQRRGIRHPWMAWLPITSLWILGSIADQYQYVVLGRVRNRRKVLLTLAILAAVAVVALVCVYVWVLVSLIMQLPNVEILSEEQLGKVFFTPLLVLLGICVVVYILGIISVVFQYICYYNLFASCDPKHKVLFLVFSLLCNVTLPFFVFACRNKDYGMPPRRTDAAYQSIPQPEE